MALTLRQIDAFNAVMSTGKLTSAAQQMGVTQPAVSRLIADLEQEVGFRLFDRTGRRVLPTAEAEMLLSEVKRVLTGLNQVRDSAEEIRKSRHSRLNLVSIQSVASNIVVDLIRAFSERHPETLVSLEVRGSEGVVEGVVSQQFDLGIGTPEIETPAFASRILIAGMSRCILPRDHPLGRLDVIRPADLEGESFVSFRPDSAFRAQLDAIFEDAGVTRDIRFEARTGEVICGMVAAGLGVSVVGPLGLRPPDALHESRVLVRPFEPAPRLQLSLIWSTHRPLPAIVESFMEVIDAYFADPARPPTGPP